MKILIFILLLFFYGCTLVPPITTNPPPGPEAYLTVPDKPTLRLVLSPYDFAIERVEFEIRNLDTGVAKSHTLDVAYPVSDVPFELNIYQEVKGLAPGRYTLRVRCWNPGFEGPAEWSNEFKFKKNW
jgi:hypothetical protein